MKRLMMAAMLLLSIASVAFGQESRSLAVTNQIRVYPIDTTNATNFSYVYRFTRSGKYILGQTSTNSLIRSSDEGKTWQKVNLQFNGGITLAMSVTDSGTILASGLYSPVGTTFRSTDNGNTWTAVSQKAGRFFANALDGSIVSGGQNSVYRSTDDGRTWMMIADSSLLHRNSAMSLFTTNKGTILMGVGGGSPDFYGIYRSTDNGSMWDFTNSGLPTGDDGGQDYVVNFAETSGGIIFAGTGGDGVYESTDDGKTWQKVPLPTNPVEVGDPSILISDNLGLFVGDGNNIISDGLFHSTDNGATWSVFGFKGCQIGAMMQLDTNEILANINGSIYILTLNVVSLPSIASQMPTSLDSIGVNAPITFSVAASDPNGDTLTYTWRVNGIVQASYCDSLTYTFQDISPATTVSVVVSNASGASDSASWSFKVVTSVNEPIHDPTAFTLSQNYPNPFNPTTQINYSVPRNSYVTLKVYNALGQEVVTLFSGMQHPGNYVATFDGSRFASGLYFYRLQADNFSVTKKMILMK